MNRNSTFIYLINLIVGVAAALGDGGADAATVSLNRAELVADRALLWLPHSDLLFFN